MSTEINGGINPRIEHWALLIVDPLTSAAASTAEHSGGPSLRCRTNAEKRSDR